ncbi:MAG: sensor histidine kinase [Acidobacteriota bacterium]
MANQNVDAQRSCLYIRILRSGVRPIGCIQLRGQILEEATIGALVSLVSLTLERTRALSSEVAAQSESLSEGLRSTVLDSLAHSIKTPLTTIAVSVAGAAAIGGLSETQGRLLQGVQEQTERITSLTNRLLRTARLDAKMVVRFRDVDLADLVQASVRVDGDGKRIKLAGTEKPIAVSIDPDLLKMAIAQIVENAVKYSPPDSPVSVLLFTDQEEAFISIHNQGSFIPQAERSAIFQRFYRGQKPADCAPGTGLGLSVAKHAVEALGGVITVASDPEVGTTFTIQIPIQRRDG